MLRAHPEYLGERHKGENTLPILIKFIDAKKDLSVQVHPTDEYAQSENENGRGGKTRCGMCGGADGGKRVLDSPKKTQKRQGGAGESRQRDEKITTKKHPPHKKDVFSSPHTPPHPAGGGGGGRKKKTTTKKKKKKKNI